MAPFQLAPPVPGRGTLSRSLQLHSPLFPAVCHESTDVILLTQGRQELAGSCSLMFGSLLHAGNQPGT